MDKLANLACESMLTAYFEVFQDGRADWTAFHLDGSGSEACH
jgi:hypothetical protein